MKLALADLNQKENEEEGWVVFVCNNIYKIISSASRLALFQSEGSLTKKRALLEIDREGQFAAYVNNRMNILIMWIQHRSKLVSGDIKQHLQYFLHDMEHHFVDPHVDKNLRDAFRWLRIYIKTYPACTELKQDRKQRAFEMAARVYEAVGISFPLGTRICRR